MVLAIDVLGTLAVSVDGRPVELTSPKLRALLIVLAMEAGSTVPVDRLTDALWGGDDLPENARRSVQIYIARLRNRLGSGSIATGAEGYQLCLDRGQVDVHRFTELLDLSAQAPDVDGERVRLAEAFALWRGDPFDDVSSLRLAGLRTPLVERYLAAVERFTDLELVEGRHGAAVARLHELTALHPLRESLWARLLTALDRCGRQAEALASYEVIRQRLADELGVDPGPELRELHADLLAGRPAGPQHAATPTPTPVTVPRQLPGDVQGFTGRVAALQALRDLVANRDQPTTNAASISVVAGMAGVGKTALAIHCAHEVAGDFTDGQLYVDLHGYEPAESPLEPTEPLQALGGLLRALGVPPTAIPADVEEAAALYRSSLAGRRVLVVLDNAGGADQVRPLLPGSPTCPVIITSRDRIAGLVATHGAQQLALDVLTPDEALSLLERAIGADRVAAEPEATRELARTCAFLPLALRITAANLAGRPERSVTGYLDGLRGGDLDGHSVVGEPQLAVQVAFDASYRRLVPPVRRVFRLLGTVPGPDASVRAAAALVDVPPDTADRSLDVLVSANLVEPRGAGRVGLHDLLRQFARERAEDEESPAERAAALDRLFDFYLRHVEAAADLLFPEMLRLPEPATTDRQAVTFDSHAQALAWLDAERVCMVAAVRYAAENGPPPAAWLLADAMRGYFWMRRHSTDWLPAADAALAAATDAGDERAQAAARLNLGNAFHAIGRLPDAIENYTVAHELAGRAGWTDAQAASLGNVGALEAQRGNLRKAAENQERALPLFRQTGQLGGQANTVLNLGYLLHQLGRLREAADRYTEAIGLYRQLGSRDGEAFAYSNLGSIHIELGQVDIADRLLSRALPTVRETGDRVGQTMVVRTLAMLRRDTGRHAEAMELMETAIALTGATNDRLEEAVCRNILASVHLACDRPRQAADSYRRALDLARRIGTPMTEATAELGLAAVDQAAGHYADAADRARRVLTLAAQRGLRVVEGRAHTSIADALRALGHHAQALDHVRRAVHLHHEAGHRLGLARALRSLGSTLYDTGDPATAERHWREALDLFTEVGSPEAGETREFLRGRRPAR